MSEKLMSSADRKRKAIFVVVSKEKEEFWRHVRRKNGVCCNLTDHIRLPIIHTKTYIHNRDKR